MLSNSRSTSVSPIRPQARCRTPLSVKSNNTNHSGSRSRSPSRSPSRAGTPLKHKPSLIYSNSIRLSGLGDENFPQLSPSPKRHMKTQVLPSSPLKRTKLYSSSSSSPSKQSQGQASPLHGSNTIFNSSLSANPSPITSKIRSLALASSHSASSSLSLSSTTSAQQNQTQIQSSQNQIQQKLQKLPPTPFKIFEDPVNHKIQTNASSKDTPNMDLEDKENNNDTTIDSKDTQLKNNNKQHSSTKRKMLAELHILEYPGYIQLHNVAADSSSLSSGSSSSLASGSSPKKDTFPKDNQKALIRQLK
ncbi:unnamed protein product [Ambrosiozyma monospora]|uniref:Unnamed protein product n=1 Tax=Ambrosiozyma monospora TaxID=43982 RepID=A0ACB5T6C8_AMBMO|nr:unnamed protein product [Ambrosiozyma monospora]